MSSTISTQTFETRGEIPTFRTEPWGDDFSEEYYLDVVSTLQNDRQLYTFSQAAEIVSASTLPVGLLRHDIDTSPQNALKLAAYEAELGIHATYFVIANSTDYDISHSTTASLLKEIAAYGHEVGLHYNPSAEHRQNTTDIHDLEAEMVAQAGQLSNELGLEIRSQSFHEPGYDHPTWMNGPLYLGRLVNAYAGVFMSPKESALYATDSSGVWNYGEPIARVRQAAEAHTRVIQVLTHAEWWNGGGHLQFK